VTDGAEGPPEPGAPEPGRAEAPPPLHASLQPRGEAVAWSALGSLLAGPLVWGGIGYLADQWLGTGRVLTAIGVVGGSLTAFYIVYLRFGRDG
jgi:F0F1-type ATP synthase assembly protein I